jgi:hypothetical protein
LTPKHTSRAFASTLNGDYVGQNLTQHEIKIDHIFQTIWNELNVNEETCEKNDAAAFDHQND